MSKKDKVEKSVEDEIKHYDEFLEGAKDIADIVPGVQERKKEAKAKLTFVKFIPDEVFIEFEDLLCDLQSYDEQWVKKSLPTLPKFTSEMKEYMMSPTGSTSAYSEVYNTVINREFKFIDTEWAKPISETFNNLSEEKAKKKDLPEKLNKINDDLGEMFIVALASIEKARSGIVGVDQAAKQLRDVIEQLWGGIAYLAKNKGLNKYKGTRLELSREKSRNIVVECLAKDSINEKKLVILLNNMANIHSDLSEREFGKNPLSTDVARLNNLYSRWILLIDDIVGYINLNIGLDQRNS